MELSGASDKRWPVQVACIGVVSRRSRAEAGFRGLLTCAHFEQPATALSMRAHGLLCRIRREIQCMPYRALARGMHPYDAADPEHPEDPAYACSAASSAGQLL